ncbi:hypothetical protein BYT27DRAFT_7107928 [Phlegmacium glaucopus]|nr:hypothetical protein BYT27DRAFT_7107928 [Phlegmacium glaucopus]
MESNVQTIRSFKKNKPLLKCLKLQIISHISCCLASASTSLLLSSPNELKESSSSLLSSAFNKLSSLGESSSQPRLIQSPQSEMQKLASKFKRMEALLKDLGFDSVGKFLQILFYNPGHNFRAKFMPKLFLQGRA